MEKSSTRNISMPHLCDDTQLLTYLCKSEGHYIVVSKVKLKLIFVSILAVCGRRLEGTKDCGYEDKLGK